VLLGGFVFHNKNWQKDGVGVAEGEEGAKQDAVVATVNKLREQLEKVCVHEVIIQKQLDRNTGSSTSNSGKTLGGKLCPVVAAETTKEVIVEAKEVLKEEGRTPLPLPIRVEGSGDQPSA